MKVGVFKELPGLGVENKRKSYVTASGKKYAYPSYQERALAVELNTKTLTKQTSEAGTVMEGIKLTVKKDNALEENPVGK